MKFIKCTKIYNCLLAMLASCLLLCSCNVSEKADNQKAMDKPENDEMYSYIKDTYGFVDKVLYGEYKANITREGNTSQSNQKTTFKDNSKGGAVFFKTIGKTKSKKEAVCIYLSDTENNKISLNVKDIKDEHGNSKEYTTSLAEPHMKNKCYCLVKGGYLICAELAEKNEGWIDGYNYIAYEEKETDLSKNYSNLVYEEKVVVYNLSNDMKQELEVKRTIDPKNTKETKVCEINKGNDKWIYASGFSSYKDDSAVLLEREQDFCDKANELLNDISVNEFKFTRTSWENRWYRLEIDESGISKDMVKVSFKSTPGKVENDTVTSDIEIVVNGEEETHGELSDEGDDNPVKYESVGENEENISVDKIKNINGTWVSSDEKYVFEFKCQEGSMGIDYNSGISLANGEFSYVNTNEGNKRIQGTFNLTDDNTLIATANLSEGKTITFSIEGDKMISDEISLNKIPDEVVTQFEGTWQNSYENITFGNDGMLHCKGDKKSTWGYYYVLSETRVLVTDKSDDYKVLSYSITKTKLVLNEKETYNRVSEGADAKTLQKFKNAIVGTWKPKVSENEEYRFNSEGTWARYQVFYNSDGSELISEHFLEGGTYRVLSETMLEIVKQDGVQSQQFNYNEVLGTLSGNGISLYKK